MIVASSFVLRKSNQVPRNREMNPWFQERLRGGSTKQNNRFRRDHIQWRYKKGEQVATSSSSGLRFPADGI